MLRAGPNRAGCTRTPTPPRRSRKGCRCGTTGRWPRSARCTTCRCWSSSTGRRRFTGRCGRSNEVQLCSLLSVKTGGCPEDCAYCPQAARYQTGVEGGEADAGGRGARGGGAGARKPGATRFCMGAAWREVKDGPQFDAVLEMVRGVRALGMEACCTLGMLTDAQARRLKEAGLDRVQPQPRHLRRVLRRHHLHPHLRRPPADAGARARGRHLRLLRRHHRHGRVRGRPLPDAAARWPTRRRTRRAVPINALVPVKGTPLAGAAAGRRGGAGADDRHRADPDAAARWCASPRAACR